jgi:hypothetical protein
VHDLHLLKNALLLTLLMLLHKLEHFRDLKLNRCIFEPMCYPKLQELSLGHCDSIDNCISLIRSNRQITKLEVNGEEIKYAIFNEAYRVLFVSE